MNIAIIGGGVAGLTAGIFAQKNGFSSTVYEKNPVPGGECTGWDRQGCHIDGCVDWLTGSKPGSSAYDLWVEVGALENTRVIQRDVYTTFEYGGKSINLWADLNRIEQDMLAIAPEDTEEIQLFIKNIREMSSMQMPIEKPMDMMGPLEMMKIGMPMAKAGMLMNKYGDVSCADYAEHFKSPFLKKMFVSLMEPEWSVSSLFFTLANFTSGNGGYPEGGSRAMALRMAEKYKSLGGNLILNAPASEILVENGQAVGLRLESGEEIRADYVIAACDADVTLNRLLKGKYSDDFFTSRYSDSTGYPNPGCVQIAWKTDADLSKMPRGIIFECEPYTAGSRKPDIASIKNYAFDPTLNPPDKQLLIGYIVQDDRDYPFWEKLSADKTAYQAEKARLAAEFQSRVEKRFPELAGRLDLLDVATPMTYTHWCGAYHGAYMSFMMTPGKKGMSQHSGILEGLDRFFITGQWIAPPGGLPGALTTGKFTIQRICKKEKLKFKA